MLIVLFLAVSGCSQVEIKDGEDCVYAGKDGAFCFHELSDKQRDLTPEQFEKEAFGWICTGPDNYANKKSAVEGLCHAYPSDCSYEDQQQIEQFWNKVDTAKKKKKKKKVVSEPESVIR